MIFADEPTGALDSHTAREVLALLRGVVDGHGQTVIMVTHDPGPPRTRSGWFSSPTAG
ncbi:hypothetical protein Slala03_73860 [Streptomyces lavendulae subsp. lavendulae]|nr:hypothetical protein Slala03_73860 [Streptomyces lavendulae subsp. lavendulae]